VLLESIDAGIRKGSERDSLRNTGKERPPRWLSLAVADSFLLFHPVYSKNSSDIQGMLRSLWLVCTDSINLSFFMEIVHVNQGRRENI